jgi:GT2 family glycosyltransferase
MDLSICILTHSQPDLLPLCVASCITEIERAKTQTEIVIVDNATADEYPLRLFATYPQVSIIRSEQNLGFSAGNNLAIRQSHGRYVLILNDDVVLQQNCLQLMLKRMESDAQIGALGPKLLNSDGSVQKGFSSKRAVTLRSLISDALYMGDFFARWRLTRLMLTQRVDDDQSAQAAEIAGACLLVRRKALDAIGLFDESFYYWFEDTDLCWRLGKAGWKLFYLAEARATHYGSASLRKLDKFERSMMFYDSQMHFLRKHLGPWRYQISKLIFALVLASRAPIAFIYRVWRDRGDLGGAKNSAQISLRIARWLIAGCE